MLRCACFMRKKEESLLWSILEIQIFLIIGNFESLDLIILVYAYTRVIIDIVICYIPHQFSFKHCHVDHDLYFTISSIKKAGDVFFTHFIPFQPSGAFYIETSHMICSSNPVTGFFMKCNT